MTEKPSSEFAMTTGSFSPNDRRNIIRTILLDALTEEFGDASSQDAEHFIPWFEGIRQTGVYMFFSPVQTADCARLVAENLAIRRFVLSLADRVETMMAMSDLEKDALLSITLSIVDIQSKKNVEGSLIPRDVAAAIALDSEELAPLLKGNTWLTVIYLYIITGVFAEVAMAYTRSEQKG